MMQSWKVFLYLLGGFSILLYFSVLSRNIWIILFSITLFFLVYALDRIITKKRLRRLPDIDDKRFYEMLLQAKCELPLEFAKEERRNIGRTLGIPYQKLSPLQTFDELNQSFEISSEKFEWDLEVLFNEANINVELSSIQTIGDLIYYTYEAKQKISGNQSKN